MKKIMLVVSFALTCSLSVNAQFRSNRDLLGKWQNGDFQLEFFSDHRVFMTIPGGKLPIATYAADFMTNPIQLDISVVDNGQKINFKGKLQFIDDDDIRLEYFGNGSHDSPFAKGQIVNLKKTK